MLSNRYGSMCHFQDTVTGFLLGGIGELNAKTRKPNFLIVDKSEPCAHMCEQTECFVVRRVDTTIVDIDETFKSFLARDDIGIILISQYVRSRRVEREHSRCTVVFSFLEDCRHDPRHSRWTQQVRSGRIGNSKQRTSVRREQRLDLASCTCKSSTRLRTHVLECVHLFSRACSAWKISSRTTI
jgi:vacuolar-type H+-ATPase subunit F/Vma7